MAKIINILEQYILNSGSRNSSLRKNLFSVGYVIVTIFIIVLAFSPFSKGNQNSSNFSITDRIDQQPSQSDLPTIAESTTPSQNEDVLLTKVVATSDDHLVIPNNTILPGVTEDLAFDHAFDIVTESIPVDKPFLSNESSIHFLKPTFHDFVFDSIPSSIEKDTVHADIGLLADLSTERLIAFPIPHLNLTFIGRVNTSTEVLGTRFITGPVQNLYNDSITHPSFSISSGKNMTFATVDTGKEIFYFEIDNATGNGVVYSENQLDKFQKEDDSIPPQVKPT